VRFQMEESVIAVVCWAANRHPDPIPCSSARNRLVPFLERRVRTRVTGGFA
jgi:hypothetical protein